MSDEQKKWTTEFAVPRQMIEAYGATDQAAGRPSGERLEGVPVMFNPTVEEGKSFCIGVGESGEQLELHCTEQTWRETKEDPAALRATRQMVITVKAAVNRRKLSRVLGIPNFG